LKQYLQIYTVKPASLEEIEDKERFNQRMPPSVKKFLINNDVKWFVYSKPFRKEKQKNKENEFEVPPPPVLFVVRAHKRVFLHCTGPVDP